MCHAMATGTHGCSKYNDIQISLSTTESIQFLELIPISLRSIVKLSSHVQLGLPSLPRSFRLGNPVLRSYMMLLNKHVFTICQTTKLEDPSLSAVNDFLFKIFVANFLILRPTPLSAIRRDMP